MGQQARLAHGERAGFIKSHGLHAVRQFQRLHIFDQDAVFGRHTRARHDGHGRGQTQSARAGNDQHGHRVDERCFKIGTHRHPRPQGDQGDHQHHRHKHFGHFVHQALNGRFGSLCVFDQSDDVREHGFVAHGRHAHEHTPFAIDRPACQSRTRCLGHGQGLSGQHGFVHLGLAFDQFAIQRKTLTGPHHDPVAHQDFVHRHIDFAIFTQPMGFVRAQGM